MATTTTTANLSKWIQAAPSGSTHLRLITRDTAAHILLELDAAKILEAQSATETAAQIVETAEQWAQGAGADGYFVIQFLDHNGKSIAASQFRVSIGGNNSEASAWAQGTPEGVISQLQAHLAASTKLHLDGFRTLQKGFADLTGMQQERIRALEAERTALVQRASDLEDAADGGVEEAFETERFGKLIDAGQEIYRQYQAGKIKPAELAEAMGQALKDQVGEAAKTVVTEATAPAAPAPETPPAEAQPAVSE